MSRSLVYSLLWSIAGDGRLKVRQDLGEFIRGVSTIPLPQATAQHSVIDYEACSSEWFLRATAGTAIAHLSHRNSISLSVRLSVRLSHGWIRQKRCN